MSLLAGFEVVQLGGGTAAAVCGRLLVDVGAEVTCIGPDTSTPLSAYLNHGKKISSHRTAGIRIALARADLIVCEGRPRDLRALEYDVDASARSMQPQHSYTFRRSARPGPRPTIRRPT